jgi:peptidyl-prolyl cis-trans isomerase C
MKKLFVVLLYAGLAVALSYAASGAANAVPDEVYSAYVNRDYKNAEGILTNALATAKDADTKFALNVELGDLYLDKLRDYVKAASTYNTVIAQYPEAKNIADVYYRLAVTDERQEKYLDAAQGYEKVAIKYQGSTYADDALNAIERCFRKNYQDRAAVVDSYPITRLEFDDAVSRAPSQYEKFDEKLKLVNTMIDDRLLYAEAVRQGLDRTSDFVNQIQDFRRDQMMQAWYDREVVKKVAIDDSMKRNYYKEHKNEYVTPEQIKAREIQVKTKAQADSLRALALDKKVSFETLAKANSLAPDKDRGGDMGFFRRGVRAKEIDEAAFALQPGEISKVVKTGDSSYTILKLEERRDKKEKSFDDVAAEIEGRLKPQRTQKRLADMLDLLKKGRVTQDSMNLIQNKDPLAVVNGAPITIADLNKMMERIPPMYRAQFENPEGKKRILDQLITEKLVMHEAELNKYWLANDLIGQTIDREHQLLIQMIKKQNSTDKAKVEDKDIQADYKKTIKDFYVPEQVRAKEIVLKSQPEAIAVRKQLTDAKHPVSFDSLAKAVSTAPSKWSSGDMGLINKGQKPKPIDNVLFSLKPKAISNVVRISDSAYSLMTVVDHKKAYTRPLAEVRPKIERKLRTDVEKKLLESFQADLRKKAKIEILLTEENTAPPPADTIPPAAGDSGKVIEIKPEPGSEAPAEVAPISSSSASVMKSVYFAVNRSRLVDKARQTLDSLVTTLKAEPGVNITIAGIADKDGPDAFNQELSLKRARTVMNYLVEAGIDAKRMEIKALGETGAKANETGEYWKDRRVDIIAK